MDNGGSRGLKPDSNDRRFVGNAPTNATDPSGLEEFDPTGDLTMAGVMMARLGWNYLFSSPTPAAPAPAPDPLPGITRTGFSDANDEKNWVDAVLGVKKQLNQAVADIDAILKSYADNGGNWDATVYPRLNSYFGDPKHDLTEAEVKRIRDVFKNVLDGIQAGAFAIMKDPGLGIYGKTDHRDRRIHIGTKAYEKANEDNDGFDQNKLSERMSTLFHEMVHLFNWGNHKITDDPDGRNLPDGDPNKQYVYLVDNKDPSKGYYGMYKGVYHDKKHAITNLTQEGKLNVASTYEGYFYKYYIQ